MDFRSNQKLKYMCIHLYFIATQYTYEIMPLWKI